MILVVRRYRCRWCGHTVTVVPRGVAALRHYGGYAIAVAFWKYGVDRQSIEQTRRAVDAGGTFDAGWPSVRRWARAVGGGQLFRGVRPWPPDWTVRQQAERIARVRPQTASQARRRCGDRGASGSCHRTSCQLGPYFHDNTEGLVAN